MKILLLTAHDVAEYDDVRMFTDIGYDVFSIGGYTDPRHPATDLRPPLDLDRHPDLEARCIEQREKHAGDTMQLPFAGQIHNIVDWAKADLHQDIIDWADVIICHHYLESWIVRQWDRLRDKRVIWRTCGQSNALLEEQMAPLHDQGLQIVRYSPREEVAFRRLGTWAGQDALIRFGKYPADYGPWIGDLNVVGNVTQNMAGRGEFCGLYYWLNATQHLPNKPAGLLSEDLPNGQGALPYLGMLEYLRRIRAYLYTGTQPASYTLGLIEAMLSGVPVLSMGREGWWVPDLFEGPEIAIATDHDPAFAALHLSQWIDDIELARVVGEHGRQRALDLFDVHKIGRQWADFLGGASVESSFARESVSA